VKAKIIDVSKYQTNDAKNPSRFFDPFVAKEQDIDGTFIRASGGILKDSAVDTFARTFTEAGIPHGFYHYAYPTTTYARQVDLFWDIIKDFQQDFPPVMDLEQEGVYLDFTQSFLGRLGEKCGRAPIIYTRAGYWDKLAGSDKANWILKYPLWVANYKYNSYPVYATPEGIESGAAVPIMPNVWKSTNTPYTFWQYSQSGNGEHYGGNYDPVHVEKVPLDLNVFNGTKETMYARFEIGEYVPPLPTEKSVRIVTAALKFRSKAELYPGMCLLVGYGDKLKFLGQVETDILWYWVEKDGYKGYVSANSTYSVLE